MKCPIKREHCDLAATVQQANECGSRLESTQTAVWWVNDNSTWTVGDTHLASHGCLLGTRFPGCSSHSGSDSQRNRNHSPNCHNSDHRLQCHFLFVAQGLQPGPRFVLLLPQLRSAGTVGTGGRVRTGVLEVPQVASIPVVVVLALEGELFVRDRRTSMAVEWRAWLGTDRRIKLLVASLGDGNGR